MKININKNDIIWSYLGICMSLFVNILLLPFLIVYLDSNKLGLWYIFTSIGAIATLFDFGFSITFSRNITYCWSGAYNLKKENVVITNTEQTNFLLMKKVLLTCKYVYLLIAVVAGLLMLTIGSIYILYITKDLNRNECILSWVIYTVAVFLNLYYGYFASFLRGVGAFKIVNQNTVYARMTQFILTIVLLISGCSIIGVCIGYLAYGSLFRILGKYRFYKYKDIGINLDLVNERITYKQIKNTFNIVWYNAWRDGIILTCNYCCNQVSILICSMYLSLSDTGIYSLGVQIMTAIAMVASTVYTIYQPVIQSAYISGDKEKVRNIMSFSIVIYIILFMIGMIGFIFIGLPILELIKPEITLPISIIIGIGLYQFILVLRNCYCSYFSSTNRIPYLKSFIIASILCVVFSFIFMGYFNIGIWGIIMAQIISQLLMNAWYWGYKANKELNINFYKMFIIFFYHLEKIGHKNKF